MGFAKEFDHNDALFEAALEEFISEGYDQASINRILQQAGMSKGQFYYHFQNKEGLYMALIDVMIARKQAFLSQVMQPQDFQADIFSVLKTQVRYSMAFAAEYPQINHFAESFLKEKGHPIYEKALASHTFEENQGMNRLIDAAFARGDFRSDLPLPFIKKTITYLFTHFGDIVKQDDRGGWQFEEVEDDLNHLIDFMKNGLAAESRADLGLEGQRQTVRMKPSVRDKSQDWNPWQS